MRIAVCIKQILDPEAPASKFEIDHEQKRQKPNGQNMVISSFDENALEIALNLKDANSQNTHITTFTVGEPGTSIALKTALARGADEAILINDPILHHAPASHIASAIACAIKKLPPYDLILSGCVSGDWSDGVVGGFIAEILAMPFLACATEIHAREDGIFKIIRPGENGIEIWESPSPISASIISSAANTKIRYSKLKDIMAANKKPIPNWFAVDIGFNPNTIPPHAEKEELRIFTRETNCEMIPDGEPQEQAVALLAKLRERRTI